MPNFYVDHGAYASDLGATPTWGVPQEGDGSSKDAATASAIASIKFNAVPTSGAYTLAGASVSVTGVLSAASAAAAATALAANINATTATVSSTAAVGTPQLRNLVFARVDPGDSEAVQIMTRVGSATLNHATNSNVAQVHTFNGTAPTVVQFTGGSGGCWGWLCNPAAIGVGGSYAAASYGVMIQSSPLVSASQQAPEVGALPGLADVVWARTGSGKTITLPNNTALNFGSPTYQHHLVFDSATKWTTDPGTGQVVIAFSASSVDLTIRLLPATGGHTKSVRCARKGGLRLTFSMSSLSTAFLSPGSSGGGRSSALWAGVIFEHLTSGTGANTRIFASNTFGALRFKDCDLIDNVPRSSWQGMMQITSLDGTIIWEGGRVVNNHTGGSDPGQILNVTLGATGSSVRLIGVDFSGWSFGKYRVGGAISSSGCDFSVEGCTGITLGPSYAGLSGIDYQNPHLRTSTITSADAGLAFRHEFRSGVVDWNPDASPAYPTRAALLMDGVTPWSIKLDWFASTVTPFNSLTTPRMSAMSRLASGVRTVAVDFLTPVTLTETDVSIRVHYIGTDNRARCETSFAASGALTTPTNTWAGAASYPSHNAKRLTLTTTSSVKIGTEVAVYFEVTGNPPGNVGTQLYVDPEFALT